MFVRTGRRGFARSRLSAPSRTHWATTEFSPTIVGGAGTTQFDLGTQLQTEIGQAAGGQTDLKGWKVVRIVGRILAVPTVAPAAGTKDVLNMVIGMYNENIAVGAGSAIDPSIASARDQYQWCWTEHWAQPYIAAPVGASQFIVADRVVRVHRRRGGAVRVFRNSSDRFGILMSSPGTESWSVDGHLRVLFQAP